MPNLGNVLCVQSSYNNYCYCYDKELDNLLLFACETADVAFSS